jgi:hypothetical protein
LKEDKNLNNPEGTLDNSSSEDSVGPTDTKNTVYLIMVLLGACALAPWNVISSSFDFFIAEVGKGKDNLINMYTFSTNCFVLVGMMYVVIAGKKFTYYSRITFTSIFIGFFLLGLPFVAKIGDSAGYWFVFLGLLIFGFVAGVAQASIFALAGGMPFRYMAAVMFGNGLVGIIANIIRAATLRAFPVDDNGDHISESDKEQEFKGALVFFGIAGFFMFFCACMMRVLIKNPCF